MKPFPGCRSVNPVLESKSMDHNMTELDLEFLRREHRGFDWTLMVLPGETQILGSQQFKDGRAIVATIRKTEEGDYGCAVRLSYFFSMTLLGASIHSVLDEALRSAISTALISLRKIIEGKPMHEICEALPLPIVQSISESLIKGQIVGAVAPTGSLVHFELLKEADLPEVCKDWNSKLSPRPAMFSLDEDQGIISCDFSELLRG